MKANTMFKMPKDKNQHIQVFVRVRPLNSIEMNSKSSSIVETNNKDVIVNERPLDKITKTFSFDKVFGSDSKQVDVYKSVVHPLIDEVLQGYNCTVFAYGQTGTGKTFTMEGERSNDATVSWDNDPSSGIIPRTLSNLFDELRILQAEYTVRVSFLEVYNEELFDLLSPSEDANKNMRIFEDVNKKGSVIVNGLEEVTVHNKNEVYKIMEKGSIKRQTASTLMNAQSSRSHTIFSITVHIKENSLDGEELLKTGKLNLVDLAGSENVGRSGAVDKRAREAGNINQSLLTLGRCITALVERAPHIPYREAKLTRLLQDSLGGRTKTSIIATISPAACNMEETLSTLDYAHRAKNITNRPEINQKLTKKVLLKEYTEEMERMRRDLAAARDKNGVYLATENYQQMILRQDSQEQEIASKIANIRALETEMEKKDELCRQLGFSLEERTEELRQTSEVLQKTTHVLAYTKEELKSTQQDRDEHHHLVETHLATEKVLGSQAHQLLAVADESSTDTYRLHDKLTRKRSVDEANNEISRDFRYGFQQKVVAMEDGLIHFTQEQQKVCSDLRSSLASMFERGTTGYTAVSNQMSSLVNNFNQMIQDLQTRTSDHGYSSQQWTQQFLNSARGRADSETNTLHQFLVDFAPSMQAILHTIQSIQMDTQDHSRYVTQQLKSQQELIGNHVLSQTQTFTQWTETLVQLIQSQQVGLQRSQETVDNLAATAQAEELEFFNKIMDLVAEKKLQAENRNKTLIEVSNGFSHAIEKGDQVVKTVVDSMNVQNSRSKEFNTGYNANINDLSTNFNSYAVRMTGGLSDAKISTGDVTSSVNCALRDAETAWTDSYSWMERELRERSENVHTELQVEQESIQGLVTVVRNTADSHEASLEHQRVELASFVRNSESELEGQCSYLTDWSQKTVAELRQRDQEVEKFVSEDLRRDLPTGSTPNRKNFSYPTELAATSPHESILARYRAMRDQGTVVQENVDVLDPVYSDDSDTLLEGIEARSPPVKNEDSNGFNYKSASTSDLTNLQTASKSDMNMSVQSEPGYMHENKENGQVLFVQPAVLKKRPGPSKMGEKAKSSGTTHKRPLTQQNKHRPT